MASSDGIRSWIEYKGHVPSIVGEIASVMPNLGFAPSDMTCKACGEGWPCRDALRAERDWAERECGRRGDLLRDLGVVPDDEDHHPDSGLSPRTTAIRMVYDELLRGAVDQARGNVIRLVNVLAWHEACGPNCKGIHHEETMVMAPGGMTHEEEAGYVAETLFEQYGATYCAHGSYPPSEQDGRIAAYAARELLASAGSDNPARRGEYRDSASARAEIDQHAVVAYRIGFHTIAPFDVLRGRLAHYERQVAAERATPSAPEAGTA